MIPPSNSWPIATYIGALDPTQTISDLSVAMISLGAMGLIGLVVAANAFGHRRPHARRIIFASMCLIIIGVTAVLVGTSAYMRLHSPTMGRVSWQAGVRFWACDNQLSLRNPNGQLSGRIGSPRLYEANDQTIHFEGIPLTLPDDASLGTFMHVVGGELATDKLTIPLDDGNSFIGTPPEPEQLERFFVGKSGSVAASFATGQRCGNAAASVQVFVYQYDTSAQTYHQLKLDHPTTYAITNSTNPPDCIIIEFSPDKNQTNHTCTQEVSQ